jgi:hypothetical protein
MTESIDALVDPNFVANLSSLSVEQVRARRVQCQQAEAALSYVRRLVQGRLDIVASALSALDEGSDFDNSALVARLPEILADDMRKFSPVIRPEGLLGSEIGSDEYVSTYVDELDNIVDVSVPEKLVSMPRADLEQCVEDLSKLEKEISSTRKSVQEHLDALQAEIVLRYKSGEADVNALLNPSS